jgi:hypothetical protein
MSKDTTTLETAATVIGDLIYNGPAFGLSLEEICTQTGYEIDFAKRVMQHLEEHRVVCYAEHDNKYISAQANPQEHRLMNEFVAPIVAARGYETKPVC